MVLRSIDRLGGSTAALVKVNQGTGPSLRPSWREAYAHPHPGRGDVLEAAGTLDHPQYGAGVQISVEVESDVGGTFVSFGRKDGGPETGKFNDSAGRYSLGVDHILGTAGHEGPPFAQHIDGSRAGSYHHDCSAVLTDHEPADGRMILEEEGRPEYRGRQLGPHQHHHRLGGLKAIDDLAKTPVVVSFDLDGQPGCRPCFGGGTQQAQ